MPSASGPETVSVPLFLAVCRKNAVGYGVFRVRDFVARNDFGVLGDGQGVVVASVLCIVPFTFQPMKV